MQCLEIVGGYKTTGGDESLDELGFFEACRLAPLHKVGEVDIENGLRGEVDARLVVSGYIEKLVDKALGDGVAW